MSLLQNNLCRISFFIASSAPAWGHIQIEDSHGNLSYRSFLYRLWNKFIINCSVLKIISFESTNYHVQRFFKDIFIPPSWSCHWERLGYREHQRESMEWPESNTTSSADIDFSELHWDTQFAVWWCCLFSYTWCWNFFWTKYRDKGFIVSNNNLLLSSSNERPAICRVAVCSDIQNSHSYFKNRVGYLKSTQSYLLLCWYLESTQSYLLLCDDRIWKLFMTLTKFSNSSRVKKYFV